MNERLAIAILAAGASRRFGRAKQLAQIEGEALLHRQCRVALESELGAVAAVLGCEAVQCAAAISDLPVAILINDRWPSGLASSLQEAIAWAATQKAAGLLLLLGDQFLVTSEDLCTLAAAWSSNRQRACRACHAVYLGPPVILPAALYSKSQSLAGDQGARQLSSLDPDQLIDVDLPHAVADLDSPEQLPFPGREFAVARLQSPQRLIVGRDLKPHFRPVEFRRCTRHNASHVSSISVDASDFMHVTLAGKTAIVTGAASGIGLAIVRRYLESEIAGVVAVDIVSRPNDRVFAAAEPRLKYARRCRVESTSIEFSRAAIDAFGRIDILVINNAGVSASLNRCTSIRPSSGTG